MKIISTTPLTIPEIKVIRIGRFGDNRGYFTEIMRTSDLSKMSEIPELASVTWHQVNESFSFGNVARGLHFQWSPHQGKLIRATQGGLIDLALDIREGSYTQGKIVGYELTYNPQESFQDLVWVPPGFAHGFIALTDCRLEYFCSSTWSPQTERAIQLTDPQIDWSLMGQDMRSQVQSLLSAALIAEKDKNGLTLAEWGASVEKNNYMDTLPR